mmetsp:Transcript_21181/g.58791  ORF Transcript_21181/g.58791 Transcript_21181/m.58791 type:complete len:1160 (+) Transcript_21181:1213-4692(+)
MATKFNGQAPGFAAETTGAAVNSSPEVVTLTCFGYGAVEAEAALAHTGRDLRLAVAELFHALTGSTTAEEGGAAVLPAPDFNTEEWEEERVALEAIFGVGDCEFPSPECTRIRVDLSQHVITAPSSPYVPVKEAYLTAWLSPAAAAEPYPGSLPILALSAAGLGPAATRAATVRLVSAARDLLGSPMVYELATALPDILAEIAAEAVTAPTGSSGARQAPAGDQKAAAQQPGSDSAVSPGRMDVRVCSGGRNSDRSHNTSKFAIDVKQESSRLKKEWEEWQGSSSSKAKSMHRTRAALPAGKQRAEVLQAAAKSQVLVISGATGCGKSTQVPQFLLEQWISEGHGAACNIVCTQPRRISAVGLATRVAAERGEAVGATVGYSVRLESKRSERTRLLFCTIGILLRRLLGDPELSGLTHVVVDEVHERSVESDLLLLLLRDLVARRRRVKVVLMSATADSELFANYFLQDGAAVRILEIPGFTYPVEEYYLEDIFERTGFTVGRTSRWAKKVKTKPAAAKAAPSAPPSLDADDPETEEGDIPETWEDAQDEAQFIPSGRTHVPDNPTDTPHRQLSDQTLRSLANVEEACVNYDLVCAIVAYILELEHREGPGALTGGKVSGGGPGCILIFLPGAPEISRLQRTLADSEAVQKACSSFGSQLMVLPLHGALPTSQQSRVFDRPSRNVRKVVLSTNVAETSITIDDVTCVIDCGRVKEMGFDAAIGMCHLRETWVSQAAAKQRRGRAGRVQRGACFRTFSRSTWRRMSEHQAPEILRVPLQSLCMQVRSILSGETGAGSLASLLARALTPPDSNALTQAIGVLQSIQALDQEERLTPLGKHLAQLPLDVHIGKMLIHSVVLRCLDPCLTIAAALGNGRSVWLAMPDRRKEANAAKQVISQAAGATAKSDHLLVVAAFNMWTKTRETAGCQAAFAFCNEHFLSQQVLEAIQAGRRDLAASLADLGLIHRSYLAGMRSKGRNDAWRGANVLSGNANMVKASLCAGFYPNILRVEHPVQRYKQVEAGTIAADSDPKDLRFFHRHRGRVFLHPSSINVGSGRFSSNWLLFTEMVETSKVFVRDSSMVPAFAMLLFGGSMKVFHEEGLVKLDGWAAFKVPARVSVLLQQLRAEIDNLLAAKMADVQLDLGRSAVSEAMFQLLATDGF